ncbi:hypothetical protein DLAC_01780 [Tieghemostelium lacteum]|uniref:RecQ-mediated genome instability protein 1 n=1 Tax=Tieghemostelium lacteum TaxID=361077 RepID=A0A152A6B8_TIELA|nr:hypothetical protein DLAC_01780 [Tieghemostelium lacteum]|eukprot:KYR01768.1 hypothetical protein DLAC_01780 [Tieghemostelium lacteum]
MDKFETEISNKFKAQNIIVQTQWLKECIEFITNTYPTIYSLAALSSQSAKDNLQEEVYKQLLISDLSVSVCECIPKVIEGRDILDHTVKGQIQLKGCYLVQIISIVNISEDQEFRYQDDNSHSRTLRLLLSDGYKQIVAIEHRFMSFLNHNIAPGSKALIRDVNIRRGIILLDESNMRILGGHITELVNLKSSQIHKPSLLNNILNNNSNSNSNSTNKTTITSTTKTTTTTTTNRVALKLGDSPTTKQQSPQLQLKLPAKSNSLRLNISNNIISNINNSNSSKNDKMDVDGTSNKLEIAPKALKLSLKSPTLTNISKQTQQQVEEKFIYLKDLSEDDNWDSSNRLFKIKGLASKGKSLQCDGKSYQFYVRIHDGTDSLDVRVSDNLSLQLLGNPKTFNPQKLNEQNEKSIYSSMEGIMFLKFEEDTQFRDHVRFTLLDIKDPDMDYCDWLNKDLIKQDFTT